MCFCKLERKRFHQRLYIIIWVTDPRLASPYFHAKESYIRNKETLFNYYVCFYIIINLFVLKCLIKFWKVCLHAILFA